MKEKKFRGWNSASREMICPVYFDNLEVWRLKDGVVEILGDLNSEGLLDHILVIEYTGFTDKDGVEIYEGDLLYHDIWPAHVAATVEWSEGCWVLVSNNWSQFIEEPLRNWVNDDGELFKNFTVVGNIYENPELARD